MIQKFTCVPKSNYDITIISNGTISQIQSKLLEIQFDIEINQCSNITYLNSISNLIGFLKSKNDGVNGSNGSNGVNGSNGSNGVNGIYYGKFIFMFFNNMEYIQKFLIECIDYYHKEKLGKLDNVYFYFDSSVIDTEDFPFVTIVNIINDIIKKVNFLVNNIKNVFIDDLQFDGERRICIQYLIRNYPNIEKVNLSSHSNLLMNDMIFT
ncbi:unnamed protein product [Candida verbasci]|uniref:Uncharacterized protein n=1 Tax=Candida verbasci TaxID=1227364 RepID=A0A9W4TZB0_9ASCO|nr:unnamed protein product [Candida verbasci]